MAPKVSGFLHLPHCQNLKILYRGLKWVQNSTDSLITTVLCQGYILRATSGNGKGKREAYSKDRKEGDEPPVVQVQLTGQTLGHVFSMTSPNWQYVDWARIMPDTQKAPAYLSLLYCHHSITNVFFQDITKDTLVFWVSHKLLQVSSSLWFFSGIFMTHLFSEKNHHHVILYLLKALGFKIAFHPCFLSASPLFCPWVNITTPILL